MDFVAIPNEVFTDPAYLALNHTERDFLIHMYFKYSDCESFTLDSEFIFDGWTTGDALGCARRLVAAGLLVKTGSLEVERTGPKPRVFSFKYPSADVYGRLAGDKSSEACFIAPKINVVIDCGVGGGGGGKLSNAAAVMPGIGGGKVVA